MAQDPRLSELLSIQQAAEFVGISYSALMRRIERGLIPEGRARIAGFHKKGKIYLVEKSALEPRKRLY